MTKFTINPRVVYSGDTCYVTIAALIVISQSIYLLTHLGARTSTMSCFSIGQGKSHEILQKSSVPYMIYVFCQSFSLHLQVHYFLSLSLACIRPMIYVVMIVAMRGGGMHLYFSKKFNLMVRDFRILDHTIDCTPCS